MKKKYLLLAILIVVGFLVGAGGVKFYDKRHPQIIIKEIKKIVEVPNSCYDYSEMNIIWEDKVNSLKSKGEIELNKLVDQKINQDFIFFSDPNGLFETKIGKNWTISTSTSGTNINDKFTSFSVPNNDACVSGSQALTIETMPNNSGLLSPSKPASCSDHLFVNKNYKGNINFRNYNENAVIVTPKTIFRIYSDGMSGGKISEKAQSCFATFVSNFIPK